MSQTVFGPKLLACLVLSLVMAPLLISPSGVAVEPAESQPAADTVPALLLTPATPATAAESEAAECAKCDKCEGECQCESDGTVAAKAELTPEQRARASHKQVGIINVNVDDLSKATANCFCLSRDGRVLAGCNVGGDVGEVRIFEADGSYVETWSVPVGVEAINVRASDGVVFIAGNGKLVKLSPDGNLIETADSPHVTNLDTDKLREEVIAQNKQMVGIYKQQIEIYTQQADRLGKEIKKLDAKIAEEDVDADVKEQAEQQIAQYKAQRESMLQISEQWTERVDNMDEEPSDEVIDRQIKAALKQKMAVASISAVGENVYLGCSSPVGHGYGIWKCSADLTTGEQIVGGLRGCCGQMDVQASEDGIYVAENARHRVARFDDAGELTKEWGGRVRDDSDLDGFGSCCNPMNLAFGPDGNVYTAEDTTGRIKCYTPDGELLSHIGHAELVPGCKKVSIGVSADGEHVYMLDITRNHIVHMQRMTEEEATARAADSPPADQSAEGSAPQRTLFGSLIRVLGGSAE